MPLIKCPDCGKDIYDKSVACNACGCPLGNVSSSRGNIVFENRIEEYKRNGYIIRNREGDTVKLYKAKNNPLIIVSSIICGLIIIIFFFLGLIQGFTTAIIITVVLMFFSLVCGLYAEIVGGIVIISITRIGKIEERGNVLKQKKNH